jgi:zinc-ribbon family
MVFFGTKVIEKQLPPESKVCPNCLSVTEHTVVEQDTRVTLYFIPLFSVKRVVNYTCQKCGDVHTADLSQYERPDANGEPVDGEPTQPTGNAGKANANTTREKARTILEGRIFGDEVRTGLPLAARFSSDQILKYFYIALLVIALISVSIIALIAVLASR